METTSPETTGTAAILGAGVIGAGWAVRFVAFGWNVRVYDPGRDVAEKLSALITRVRPHVASIYPHADFSGQLIFTDSVAAACEGADWIQESLPEPLDLKRAVYASVTDPTVLASSTSGFRPSVLGEHYPGADRLIVAHPFNPVYLIPLVEVVAHPRCNGDLVQDCQRTLTGLGMHPLLVRKEIDAHIADRLLEAVWREALWLVRDGVATAGEIDDAIKYGFGLRWAQMGLFETYRLGGGDGGFRQFLAQFGPALQWPWSRLTDVPELDDELIDRIVQQVEGQPGALSVGDLEEERDLNIVAILKALKDRNWGAGARLNSAR